MIQFFSSNRTFVKSDRAEQIENINNFGKMLATKSCSKYFDKWNCFHGNILINASFINESAIPNEKWQKFLLGSQNFSNFNWWRLMKSVWIFSYPNQSQICQLCQFSIQFLFSTIGDFQKLKNRAVFPTINFYFPKCSKLLQAN